jgi:hypothetical protein
MPETAREQKITFREMRESGVRGVLVYYADHKCSHSIAICADRRPDDLRLSDIEPRFTCQTSATKARDLVVESGQEVAQAKLAFRGLRDVMCLIGASASKAGYTAASLMPPDG